MSFIMSAQVTGVDETSVHYKKDGKDLSITDVDIVLVVFGFVVFGFVVFGLVVFELVVFELVVFGFVVFELVVFGFVVFELVVVGFVVFGFVVVGFVVFGFVVVGFVVFGLVVIGNAIKLLSDILSAIISIKLSLKLLIFLKFEVFLLLTVVEGILILTGKTNCNNLVFEGIISFTTHVDIILLFKSYILTFKVFIILLLSNLSFKNIIIELIFIFGFLFVGIGLLLDTICGIFTERVVFVFFGVLNILFVLIV
jgi:hypothetical protein